MYKDEAEKPMPGMSSLGKTFNAITANYASDHSDILAIDGLETNPKGTHTVVSNADGEEYEIPDHVEYDTDEFGQKGTTADGSTTEEVSSSLAVRASIDARYGMYSGSIEASYSTTTTATNEEYYTEIFDSWNYYSLGFSVLNVHS